jgi:serine/threonine-protein kinase
VSPELDAVVLRALARTPEQRFATAAAMADALERAVRPATSRELGDWVTRVAGESLSHRAQRLQEIESLAEEPSSSSGVRSAPASTPTGALADAPVTEPPRRRVQALVIAGSAACVGVVAIVMAALGGGDEPVPSLTRVGSHTAARINDAARQRATAAVAAPVIATASSAPIAPRKMPPRSRARADCTPPYQYVQQGTKTLKRWKPQCL